VDFEHAGQWLDCPQRKPAEIVAFVIELCPRRRAFQQL
jgi:hypothetical protein